MRVSRDARSVPWTLDDDARTVLAAMSEARARQRQEVGRRVYRLRKAKGWNHEDLAHHSDLSVSTISRIERGKHDSYGGTIKQVAEALGVVSQDVGHTTHPPTVMTTRATWSVGASKSTVWKSQMRTSKA